MSQIFPVNATEANLTDGLLFQLKNASHPLNDTAVGQGLQALAESGILNFLLLYVSPAVLIILLYPTNNIVATLAEVENSSDSFQSAKKSDDQHDDAFEHELAAQKAYAQATVGQQTPNTKPVPITSSIRRTLRYLYYLSGPFSIWRGVYLAVPFWVIEYYHRKISDPVLTRLGVDPKSVYIQALVTIVIAILCIPFKLTWTQHVISQGTQSVSRRGTRLATAGRSISTLLRHMPVLALRHISVPRFPGWASVRYMVVPTLLATFLGELYNVYPQSLIHTWLLKPMLEAQQRPTGSADGVNKGASKFTGVLALAFFAEATTVKTLTFLLSGLAGTLRIRVEASLLPDDIPTVVPMDRHFGLLKSRPARTHHHHSRGITLWEAWETLTWSAIWRIAKVYVKATGIYFAVGITQSLFWAVVTALTPGFELKRT